MSIFNWILTFPFTLPPNETEGAMPPLLPPKVSPMFSRRFRKQRMQRMERPSEEPQIAAWWGASGYPPPGTESHGETSENKAGLMRAFVKGSGWLITDMEPGWLVDDFP